MQHLACFLAFGILLAARTVVAQPLDGDRVQTVRDFVAAFNAHDSAAMATFVAEDVQWLSISAEAVTVEASGKASLIAAMNDYFRSCASCRSELAGVIASHDRVSAVEVANWQGEDRPMQQRSISVYEFAGDLIQRVYYFPAEQ